MKKLLTQTSILLIALMIAAATAFAQTPSGTRQRRTSSEETQPVTTAEPSPSPTPAGSTAGAQPNRIDAGSDEEEAIIQQYNNFFTTYRLGPEDVISVNVFAQERYSKQGIVIPPSGRVYLALIPEGIFVNGKTVDQVSELIKKRYDEFIIDPQVSVSLDRAASYRYSVVGDVGQPGIRLMSRRLSVTEAIAEAGGILQTGSKSKVYVLRKQANGNLQPIPVDVGKIYKGQMPDSVYLQPGDQVIVPGNGWKTFDKITSFLPMLSFARIFTGGW